MCHLLVALVVVVVFVQVNLQGEPMPKIFWWTAVGLASSVAALDWLIGWLAVASSVHGLEERGDNTELLVADTTTEA